MIHIITPYGFDFIKVSMLNHYISNGYCIAIA